MTDCDKQTYTQIERDTLTDRQTDTQTVRQTFQGWLQCFRLVRPSLEAQHPILHYHHPRCLAVQHWMEHFDWSTLSTRTHWLPALNELSTYVINRTVCEANRSQTLLQEWIIYYCPSVSSSNLLYRCMLPMWLSLIPSLTQAVTRRSANAKKTVRPLQKQIGYKHVTDRRTDRQTELP